MKDSPEPGNSQTYPLPEPEELWSSSVTCLSSNNSTEGCGPNEPESCQDAELPSFSPYAKKQADTLFRNVSRLIELAPSPEYVGMLTLTFKDNVTSAVEAQRRFNSFNTHYLKPSPEYGHWLLTKERQKRGAWHYHIVVICRENIKEGFSPQVYHWWLEQRNRGKRRRLDTGNEYLRKLWKENRKAVRKYGFGIPHLIPMLSNPEAMARYVGKYISKHMHARRPEDRGVRLIQTSQGWPKNTVKFSWNTDNSKKWRRNVRAFANLSSCNDLYDLQKKYGPKWAYERYSSIMDMPEIIQEIEERIPF